MESHKSLGNDSSVSTSDLKDDEVEEEANSTSSEEESSTQFCSLSSEAGRHLQCFQRHQSVDEWLQGIQKVLKKTCSHFKYFRYFHDFSFSEK